MIAHLKNVSWKRDSSYILKNINWTIQPGEHWSIVGLNGSGKTSLLKIISAYLLPSEGDVTVLGEKFGSSDLRELRKSIGWVSSSLLENFYSCESVNDIIISGKFASIGLYDKAEKSDYDRAEDLLDKFGSSNLNNRIYYSLSQGEKQKILLARALMGSPKLLILDEPCTGLDIFARESFLALIELISIAQNAPTLLYVSHHLEEILSVFNHTMLLKQGSIHSSGKTEDVLSGHNLSDFYERQIKLEWLNKRPRILINY